MTVAFSRTLPVGRFETWTEKPPFEFHQVTQVHGTEIVSVETLPAEADGMILSWEDMDRPVAIKTADCLPVVILGEKGVVCVHAGWRGLAGEILSRPEVSLIRPYAAFIGPFIHDCCFEVSEDFAQNFPESPLLESENRFFFDLGEEARKQLLSVNPEMAIDVSDACTCCDRKLHSYRRNKPNQRNWNLYIKG